MRADVVVVGAGPAGLVLTELLAGAGKDVVIVERQADPTQVPQSVMLQPAGLGIMARLRIPEVLDLSGGHIFGIQEYGPDGPLFAGRYADLDRTPSTYGQILSQGALRRILLRHLDRFPNVTLLTSTEISDVTSSEVGKCRIEATYLDGAPETVVLESDWLVAADGKQSRTRELAGIKAELEAFDHKMFVTPMTTPGGFLPVIQVHRGGGGLVVTVPEAAPGITYVFTHLAPNGLAARDLIEASASIVDGHDSALAQRMMTGAIRERVMTIVPHTVSPEAWRKDGVLLLGDSAHGMHSFGAQGLNISIQNATLLADALNTGEIAQVDAVETRRRPYVDALHRAQHELGEHFWPPGPGQDRSWFVRRFEEFALGQVEFRSRWR